MNQKKMGLQSCRKVDKVLLGPEKKDKIKILGKKVPCGDSKSDKGKGIKGGAKKRKVKRAFFLSHHPSCDLENG